MHHRQQGSYILVAQEVHYLIINKKKIGRYYQIMSKILLIRGINCVIIMSGNGLRSVKLKEETV